MRWAIGGFLTCLAITSSVCAQAPVLPPPAEAADVSAPPVCLGTETTPASPRLYFGAEYLMWWTNNGPQMGHGLAAPATGWGFQAGYGPTSPRGLGIEASGFRLEQRSTFNWGR